MNLQKFQKNANKTAIYPDKYNGIYPAIALAGEAGEVCDQIKKVLRDHDGIPDKKRKEKIKDELGDTLYYLAMLCSDMGLDLEEVAKANCKKRKDKYESI